MNNHIERLKVVARLAQLIDENPLEYRVALFLETIGDLEAELRALDRNKAEYPMHAARALDLIDTYSRRADSLPVTYLHPVPEENT